MKPVVAIALLICGVVLICVPPVSDYLLRYQIMQGGGSFGHFDVGLMSNPYRAGCFLTGLTTIGVAILASWRSCGAASDTSRSGT